MSLLFLFCQLPFICVGETKEMILQETIISLLIQAITCLYSNSKTLLAQVYVLQKCVLIYKKNRSKIQENGPGLPHFFCLPSSSKSLLNLGIYFLSLPQKYLGFSTREMDWTQAVILAMSFIRPFKANTRLGKFGFYRMLIAVYYDEF